MIPQERRGEMVFTTTLEPFPLSGGAGDHRYIHVYLSYISIYVAPFPRYPNFFPGFELSIGVKAIPGRSVQTSLRIPGAPAGAAAVLVQGG